MKLEPKLIPTGSQTVGPFFRIGLEHLIGSAVPTECADTITIRGQVLDRDRAPVVDAMLEFWSASDSGFARTATDDDGNFRVQMNRPSIKSGDGRIQAPHLLVLVFARGLLRHLISHVYFGGEPRNGADPVLSSIPAERRRTLIAQSEGDDSFRWNVILQGEDETVFFAW